MAIGGSPTPSGLLTSLTGATSVASAASGAVGAATGAVGAVGAATGAVTGAVGAVTGAVTGAVGAVGALGGLGGIGALGAPLGGASTFQTARLGDLLTHGAKVITGQQNVFTNNRPTARLGDLVMCPKHGVNPLIAQLAPSVYSVQQKTAHVTSIAKCGAVIITASPDVLTGK